MTLSEIRMVLLQQHDALRAKIAEARSATEQWRCGEMSREHLEQRLQQLAQQLRAHHACEEDLLRDPLPNIDAWGQVRAETMTEMHLDEHRNLCAGLIGSHVTADPERGSAGIAVLLDTMLDHMRQEEKFLLAPEVLTDD